MNRIYQVIWSKTRHAYVVVSEIAKRNGKSKTSTNDVKLTGRLTLAVVTCLLAGGLVFGGVAAAEGENTETPATSETQTTSAEVNTGDKLQGDENVTVSKDGDGNIIKLSLTDNVATKDNLAEQTKVSDGAIVKSGKTIGDNVTNLDAALAKETAARLGAEKTEYEERTKAVKRLDEAIRVTNENTATAVQTLNDNMVKINQNVYNSVMALNNTDLAQQAQIDAKANGDASNIGANLKNDDGTSVDADAIKTNQENWGSALGGGEVKSDDSRLVSGATMAGELHPATDGNYVKSTSTTAANLTALDTQVKENEEAIANKANTTDVYTKTEADNNFVKQTTQNTTDSEQNTNIQANATAISSEEARAKAAEKVNADAIAANKTAQDEKNTALETSIQNNATAITTETNRAKAAELANTAAIGGLTNILGIQYNTDTNTFSQPDGVKLGSGSADARKAGQAGYDSVTKQASTNVTSAAWTATKDSISIGDADNNITRQITGVAAGFNDTDAVNVAQLKQLEGQHTLVTVNGTSAPKNADGKNYSGNYSTSGNLRIKADTNTTSGQTTFDIQMQNQLDLGNQGSITIGRPANGTTIQQNVKLTNTGLDNGNNALKNVGQGNIVENGTDGVNAGQLYEVQQKANAAMTEAQKHTTVVGDDANNIKVENTTAGTDAARNFKVSLGDAVSVGTSVGVTNGPTITADELNMSGKKITHVANGAETADSQEAVNGSQLYAVNQEAKKKTSVVGVDGNFNVTTSPTNNQSGGTVYDLALNNTVTIGGNGGVVVNGKDGTVTGLKNTSWDGTNYTSGRAATEYQLHIIDEAVDTNTTNIATNTSTISTVRDTLYKGMSFAGDTGTTINKKMDSTLTVSGGATDKDLSENNINVNADGNNVLSIKLAKEVTGLTSVSAVDGTNTTKLDSTGLSVNNMKFVTESGLDANNLNITNVEEGDISSASSKEAVNGGQLYTTNQTVKRNTEAINSNDRDIAALQEGWNLGTNTVTDSTGLATDTTTVDPIKAGKTLTVKAGNNISVGKTADTDGNTDLTIALRDEVTIGSGNNAITINGTDGTVSGHNFTINGKSGDMRLGGTTTPTVKISGNSGNAQFGKVVINASNGTVNSLSNTKWDIRNITSGQAATEDQLKEAIEQMGNWTGTGGTTKVEAGRNTYVDGLGTKETPYKVNVTQTLTDMREVDLVSDDYAGGTNPNAAKGKLDSSGLSFWTKENTTTTTTTDPSDSTKTITTESIMDPTKVVSVTVDGGISAGMQQVKNVKSAITKSDETTAAAFEASLNTAKQTTPNSATTIEDLSNTYNAIKSLGVDYVGNDTATETNAIVHQDLGSTMKIQGGMDKTDITNDSVSGDNLAVRKNAAGDGLDIVMTKTPAFSKVIAGTLNADKSASATAVTISDTGVQVGDKTYLNQDGLNANSQVITNVASTIESALGDTWAEKLTNASAANSTVRNNAVNVSDLNEVYNTAKKMTSVVAGDNINVTQTANTSGGTDYTVQLAKIVEMGDEQHKVKLDSTAGTVQAGSVVIGKDASFSNRDTITGLDNADWDVDTIDKDDATTYVSKRAATEDQLAKVSTVVKTNKMNIDQNASNISNLQTTVAKGFNFTGDDTAVKVNKQLGDTISIVGGQQDITKLSDGNIGVLVDNTTNNLHVRLAKMVNVESVTAGDLDPDSTAPKAVISGAGIQFGDKTYISSTGLNANDQKIINVTDGTEAHDAVNVSQLEAAKTELTNNGVRYAGDIGNEFTQKLGNTATTAMTITGGVKNATDLASGANVGVISDGAGSLKIQLAKKLTDLESVTTNGVTISGTNTNITLNSDGLDMNNKPITNVGSGLGNTDILKAGGDTLNNVATVSDLKTVAEIAAQARTEVKSADKSLTVTESTAVDNANNKSYDVSITQATLSTDTNGAVTVTNAKTKDANGQTIDNENSFVTGNTVKDAINNSGFNLTTAENGTESGTSELINPGDKVTLDAGNNMSITQTGGKITFATTSELKGISKISNNDSDDTKKTEISLGDKTVTLNESSLTGLKDGTVGKDSKDAVTGNQLQNTIDTGLTFEGNYGDTVQRALGTTLKITGGLDSGLYTSEIGHKDDNPKQSAVSSQNIGVRKNNTGDGLEIVMTQQPTFYALGAGVFNGATNPQNSKESSVIIGRDGLFVGGKKYINNTGINANDNKVTRVSAGTISSTSADAVNGSQLYTVQQKAEAHSTVSVGGNTASTDNTDINGGNLVLKRTTENNAHNYDVALNKDVVLGSTGNGNGGTLQVINDGATGDHNDIKVSGTVNNESRDFITIGSQLTNTDGQGAVTGGQGFIKFTEVKGSDVTSTRLSQSMNDTDVYGRIAPRMAYTVNKDSTNTPVGEGSYNLATLQDGTVYAGDISGTNSSDKKIQMPLNSTLTVTGGVVESGNLTNGNIGVVASQTQMTVGTNKYTTAGQLELKLAKDLKGITSISNGATDETKISLGDVQGSKVVTLNSAKVTGLADGGIKENSTDAVTGGQIYTKLADLNSSISSKSDYRLIQSTAEDGAYTVSDAGEVTLTVQDGNDTSKKGTVTIKDVASKAKLEDLTGRVNTAEGKITNNTTAIGENKTAIAGNTANITTNKNSISVNTTNISNLKNLSNISNDGKDVITGLTEVKGIGNVIVTPELDENTRKKTYTVSVDSTGAVVKDETKLVTGGTVYNAIVAHDYSAGDGIEIGTDRKISAKIAENSGLEVKTDGIAIKTDNASGLKLGTDGISVKAKDGGGITVGEDGLLINTDAIKGAINTTTEVTVDGNMTVTDTGTSGNHIYALGVKTDGSVAANDNGIISGGTLYNEVHAAPAEGQTFKYISSDNTVGANLAALDKQTGTNAENITKNAGDITTINNTLNGGLNFKGDADDSSVNKKLGETLDIKGGAAGELSDNNIGVVKDGDDLKVKLAKSLAGLSSVTSNAYHAVTTDSENNKHTTTISGDTLSVDGGVSITKGKITNVLTDSITGDTDVTNKKYVDDKITSVTTNATDYQLVSKGDGYTIDSNFAGA